MLGGIETVLHGLNLGVSFHSDVNFSTVLADLVAWSGEGQCGEEHRDLGDGEQGWHEHVLNNDPQRYFCMTIPLSA